MTDHPHETTNSCERCGDPLTPSRFGAQCLRCLFSLANSDEAFANLEESFPELAIHRVIAKGGFSSVYFAEHRRMKRPVALKLLDSIRHYSEESIALFEREMVSVARLSHPGIVQAYDAGDRDGQCYIIMELVDGEDCSSLVKRHGRLPIAESCEIVRQAALALHHAHELGLIHRDVKPRNIILSRQHPVVKVCDFGMSVISHAVCEETHKIHEQEDGQFMGTLDYIAPEQIITPTLVNAKADVFALGATLRRLLTGKQSREAMSDHTLILEANTISQTPIEPISSVRSDLPPALAKICDQLLEFHPENRPATAATVAALLAPWAKGAELLRLFDDSPLPAKSISRQRIERRKKWSIAIYSTLSLVAVALFVRVSISGGTVGNHKTSHGKPIFSNHYNQARRLNDEYVARLYSNDWERERELTNHFSKSAARLTPDGRIVRLDDKQPSPMQWTSDEETLSPVLNFSPHPYVRSFGVAPTGHFVWSQSEEPTGLHIGRAAPDRKPLESLRYDFASHYPAGIYEFTRKLWLKSGKTFCDGQPWGFAFVTSENLPKNSGLRAGDVIVADGGERGTPGGMLETKSALWHFRFDNNDAAKRFTAPLGDGHHLIDVTVSQNGVFGLNRIKHGVEQLSEDDPRNRNKRLLRWDLDGWHECLLEQGITDPCGIAADPLSQDLYITTGSASLTINPTTQRVLRLSPTGPDTYRVEVFADRFGQLSDHAIAITPDGQRMILTDAGNRAIVVLKRKASPSK